MDTQTIYRLFPRAGSGDPVAQEELAFAYVDQDKDYANAVKWLEEAEKLGQLSVRGAYTLGISYDDGRGISKDPVKAEHYYKIAADSDEDNQYVNKACFWLARGHWIENAPFGEDDEIAVYYLERVLTRSSPAMKDDAKGNLAMLHSFSSSKVFDPQKARKYIDELKDCDDEEVKEQVKVAEESLAHYEIAKAAQEIMQAAAKSEESTRLERAENGDPTAQYLLYSHASEEEKPMYEHFLISSAESGYLPAQARLVILWAYEPDKDKDVFELSKKVWDNPEFHSDDMPLAIRERVAYILGKAYFGGTITAKDEEKALEFLNIVADSKEESLFAQDARLNCAIIMLNQDSPVFNAERAATRAEQVLCSANPNANKEMALRILISIYVDPKSPIKDIEKAKEIASTASKSNNPEIKKIGEGILASITNHKENLDNAPHKTRKTRKKHILNMIDWIIVAAALSALLIVGGFGYLGVIPGIIIIIIIALILICIIIIHKRKK